MKNPLKKIRQWWRNYLRRLTEANREQFGGQTPSCCAGRPPESKHHV